MILPQQILQPKVSNYSEVLLVNSTQTNFTGTTTPSITVTPAVDGNLMIITVSGAQTRTVTPPSGWSAQIMPSGVVGGTCVMIYRISSGETGTYNFTLDANLTPGVGYYYEFSGVNVTSPFVGFVEAETGTTTTGFPLPAYNVLEPGPVVSLCIIALGTSPVWTADNGFTTFSTPSISRIAHKIYTNPEAGVVLAWTGGSSVGGIRMIASIFRAAST